MPDNLFFFDYPKLKSLKLNWVLRKVYEVERRKTQHDPMSSEPQSFVEV